MAMAHRERIGRALAAVILPDQNPPGGQPPKTPNLEAYRASAASPRTPFQSTATPAQGAPQRKPAYVSILDL